MLCSIGTKIAAKANKQQFGVASSRQLGQNDQTHRDQTPLMADCISVKARQPKQRSGSQAASLLLTKGMRGCWNTNIQFKTYMACRHISICSMLA